MTEDLGDAIEDHLSILTDRCVSPDRLLLVVPPTMNVPASLPDGVVTIAQNADEGGLTHAVETLASIVHAHPQQRSRPHHLPHPNDDVVVTGLLTDLGPADLVQVLAAAQKTVRVDFHRDRETATLWFERGRITRADAGTRTGENVFYDLMSWAAGQFDVRTIADPPESNIAVQTTALLLEALKRMDEERRKPSAVSH